MVCVKDIETLAASCVLQLQEQGYAVLPGFLTEEQLDVLRLVSAAECDCSCPVPAAAAGMLQLLA